MGNMSLVHSLNHPGPLLPIGSTVGEALIERRPREVQSRQPRASYGMRSRM